MESQNIDHKNHKDCCVEKTKETGMISWFFTSIIVLFQFLATLFILILGFTAGNGNYDREALFFILTIFSFLTAVAFLFLSFFFSIKFNRFQKILLAVLLLMMSCSAMFSTVIHYLNNNLIY